MVNGDTNLEDHLKNSSNNVTFISQKTQNNIISNIKTVIFNIILNRVNDARCYSDLADETMDVQGTEQLSICLRYNVFNENDQVVLKEDFVGIISLDKLDAESIAKKCFI